jgi:CubicO group peptidase (beta-lactamase class C family)
MRHLVACLVFAVPLSGQDQLSPSAKVDKLFAGVDKKDSPGAAVLVIQGGKVVHRRGYGAADLEHDIPITPSTVFDIASVSKQFCGLAVAMLIKEGKLSLDDDVHKHLPWVPDFKKKITIDHLLHHTSGIRDWPGTLALAGWSFEDVLSFEHILKMVRHQRELNFAPGSRHMYSNTGYNLLAAVVQEVTGKTFRQWTEENIFDPLGMKDTHFQDDHDEVVKNRARSYRRRGSGFRCVGNQLTAVGSSSLFTTIDDLSKWILNFETRKVGGEAIDLMHQRGVLNNGKQIGYAFGLGIGSYRGLETVRHGGSWAGFRTHLVRFPKERFAVVVLENLAGANAGRHAMQIADIYLGDKAAAAKPASRRSRGARPAAAPKVRQLEDYLGDYYSEELSTACTVALRKGKLVVEHSRNRDVELTPGARKDRFRGNAWWMSQARFARGEDGRVAEMLVSNGRVLNVRFTRR